jgi:uncharacterized protein with HEPN domain
MLRDDAVALDVLRAARLASEFVGGLDRTAFEDDLKTQSAVLHQLLLIGEAVKRLSEEYRSRHPQIPWKQMAGMRDVLIHQYDDVDLDEVWRTVKQELPRLIVLLEKIVS